MGVSESLLSLIFVLQGDAQGLQFGIETFVRISVVYFLVRERGHFDHEKLGYPRNSVSLPNKSFQMRS